MKARLRQRTEARDPLTCFDAEWYLRQNPDVLGILRSRDPFVVRSHFETRGWREGRSPNCRFVEAWYRSYYPDVQAAVEAGEATSGFDHFCRAGASEGRRASPLEVDASWYLERYPEVARGIAEERWRSPHDHYLRAGARRGLDPGPVFSERWYLEQYPEVARLVEEEVFLSGYQHFVEQGRRLGLKPHPEYDEQAYLADNPDVVLAVRLGQVASGWDHLRGRGLEEGRSWRQLERDGETAWPVAPPATCFDGAWYLHANEDAAAAVAAGRIDSAAAHYDEVGVAEARDPNPYFSESWYRRTFPEIVAGIDDGRWRSGFEHYVHFGCAEGRVLAWLPVEELWYRSRYPDVLRALDRGDFHAAAEHYLLVGAREGRDPHPAFDEHWYLESNADIGAEVADGRWLSGYHHFIIRGWSEGRPPHPAYDESYYLSQHADVRAALARGEYRDGYDHLIRLGLSEGRVWRTDGGDGSTRRAAKEVARVRFNEFLGSGRRLDLSAGTKPEVSVVLVVRNRAELTFQCLESLTRSAGVDPEVVVVDNGSVDPTDRLLERVDGVVAVRNEENLGFVRGANQGAKLARGRALLFLNNDTEVFPGAIRAALDRLWSTPHAAVVGGRVVGTDGLLQEAGCIAWRDGTTCGYGSGENPEDGAYLFPRTVDYCSGVFLLTPRALFEEAGGFDRRYEPAYYEEADYCFRMRAAGRTVVYDPWSVIVHLGQGSLEESWHVASFLEGNRPVFRALHQEALARGHEAGPESLLAASSHDAYRGRILFIDDRAPLRDMGSGFPRAQAILRTLVDLGYFVTLFATVPVPPDRAGLRRELPDWGLEVISHLGRAKFIDFMAEREGFYDVAVVSRRHNLRWLAGTGYFEQEGRPALVYDSEALFAARAASARAVLGESVGELGLEDEEGEGLADEIALAARAEAVWTVSRQEADQLGASCEQVTVVAHVPETEPVRTRFAERSGLLFVGRLVETWNPNVDGVCWLVNQVLPRLEDRLGEPLPLTVVGRIGDDVRLPERDGVVYRGRVEELTDLYAGARVFVAPSRFAAGIPLKVVEAAAAGVPVVASSILAGQLGWEDGAELVVGGENDPDVFADRVVRLYSDTELWAHIRAGALARVAKDYSAAALRGALEGSLEGLMAAPARRASR